MEGIVAVSIIFILAMVGIYFKMLYMGERQGNRKKVNEEKQERFFLGIVLVAGFLIRMIASLLYDGYETDINCFMSWSDMVYENGFGSFYHLDGFTDYPPGYMYVLYLLGLVRNIFDIQWFSKVSFILLKMPSILCDLVTSILLYKVASKKMRYVPSVVLAGVYLLTPAIILDGAVWGQVDSVFTLFVVLTCYFVSQKKLPFAYFSFVIGTLIKPQTLVFAPIILIGIIEQVFIEGLRDGDRKAFFSLFWKNLAAGVSSLVVFVLGLLPFGLQESISQYTETLGSYPYASVNAYNFWTLIGKNWVSQDEIFLFLPYKVWGTLSIIFIVIVVLYLGLRWKDSEDKYYMLSAGLISFVFLFSVRMHERYVYPAFALILFAYAVKPRWKTYLSYLVVSGGCFLNMAHMLFYYKPDTYSETAGTMRIIAFFVCACIGYLFYTILSNYRNGKQEKQDQMEISLLKVFDARQKKQTSVIRSSAVLGRMVKLDVLLMIAITLVYAGVAFYNLGDCKAPTTEYSLVQQGEVVLDFGNQVEISKIWDYLGTYNNPKYNVSSALEQNGEWITVPSFEEGVWDAGSVFCWNAKDLSLTCRYLRITPTEETVEDSILELAFTDVEGNVLTPVNTEDYPGLFDEPEFMVDNTRYDQSGSYHTGTYFDEIYHARTAYEMIHHLRCYEWTHPPLGKEIMAIGILLFGMNPFGWRFMGTLFGVLMLPLLYWFSKKMFDNTWVSAATTALFAVDFMHFAQTRIATIDVFVTLFIIAAYLFMFWYTRLSFFDTKLINTFLPLGLCGIAMGLSWASKWTGIYASAGLCLLFFICMGQRWKEYRYAKAHATGVTNGISHQEIIKNFYPKLFKTLGFCVLFFVVIPVIIYILSFLPFSDGTDHGILTQVIDNIQNSYNYHSNLEATHAYSSQWYEWPFMKRPILFYSGQPAEGLYEGISSFGNPLVWWGGFIAFVYMVYRYFIYNDKTSGYLSIAYLSQYLPWVFIGRVVFIYHYFPSVPFLVLMLGYSFKIFIEKKQKNRWAVLGYVAVAVLLFVMFYPVLSGTPISADYADSYLKWFSDWVLIIS